MAKSLGWFSVGLGLAELSAPAQVARLIGVRPSDRTRRTMRLLGARELAAGLAILVTKSKRAGWVWTRVAGDAIDLALLGRSLTTRRTRRTRMTLATLAVLGVTALDVVCGARMSGVTST